ncbi:MAG: hypothetical protein DRJ97_02050 [Thermoprotei archaeon]|nr:MAG: hypothetical protein DRJ97_02050 [Thermoprotei archaeon]
MGEVDLGRPLMALLVVARRGYAPLVVTDKGFAEFKPRSTAKRWLPFGGVLDVREMAELTRLNSGELVERLGEGGFDTVVRWTPFVKVVEVRFRPGFKVEVEVGSGSRVEWIVKGFWGGLRAEEQINRLRGLLEELGVKVSVRA